MNNQIPVHSRSATSFTKLANEKVRQYLNFEDKQDFEDARRGLIAPFESPVVTKEGKVVWDDNALSYLQQEAPETVNPSLWRNAQLHANTGLFKVVDGVYQVRGQTVCTTLIIEGKTGLIVCDTAVSIEAATAAMDIYYKHRPKKPVVAIIISQSHIDHYGGIAGILPYAESDDIPIIVPEHFTKETLSENILLGTAMGRRAEYQFGSSLEDGPTGYVSIGVGHRRRTNQTASFRMPTIEIKNETEEMKVDGITFRFLLTPNTEAPAEMHFYIQDYKALFVSENLNRAMHQIYTVRGAKTRDALEWVSAIQKTIDLFEEDPIDALIMIHGWPVWGKELALMHLGLQRDLYKYMHDQTVRLANHGHTMEEIAELIQLPDSLEKYWSNRGYYGTLKHNSKGIYNYYLGYYSAHPSDLDPLPQVESAEKYIQYMGGADNVLERAKVDFENGEYRWVAQVLKHVVMSEPNNLEAKNLLADTFEQLGFQAESANWRNMYLMGAYELRNGRVTMEMIGSGFQMQIPFEEFLKMLAVRINGPKADGKKIAVNLTLTDRNLTSTLLLENAVLRSKLNQLHQKPDVEIEVEEMIFYGLAFGKVTVEQAIATGKLVVNGNVSILEELLAVFDQFSYDFNIVTP